MFSEPVLVVAKLARVFYKIGNQVSDRQWSDILGILNVQGAGLDQVYLDQWAPALDVHDVLLRARKEAQAGR